MQNCAFIGIKTFAITWTIQQDYIHADQTAKHLHLHLNTYGMVNFSIIRKFQNFIRHTVVNVMYLPPYFFCHNIIFSKKYCIVASLSQNITFESQHIIFSKDIVLCAMSATQYFLKKIMCCGSLSQHIIFFKNYCVVASLSQHITFWVTRHYYFKKYCVVRHVRNTIFLKKIMCCGKFVTTHYFLRHNTFFSKNIVLWQVCRILLKIWTAWVGRTSVSGDRQQTDGRVSSRSLKTAITSCGLWS